VPKILNSMPTSTQRLFQRGFLRMCLVQGTLQSTGKRSSLPRLGGSQACLFERDYKHKTVLDVEVRDHTPAKLDVGTSSSS
jgi:hypothetical protein